MTRVDGSQRWIEEPNDNWVVVGTVSCDECKWHSLAYGIYQSPYPPDAEGMWSTLEEPDLWLPAHGTGQTYEDGVPDHIASAASEAHSCHSIGAYRAAILMARSVIEATAKAKGIKTGSLFVKIDAMTEKSLLRPLIQTAAHEVRAFGNDMAHGDFEEVVTNEDSAEVLGLMAEVLHEVWQSPTRIARRKAKREARGASVD
ncbi:MAG: DUF4145 domain-containing protein [Aeromicrobium erythreum]